MHRLDIIANYFPFSENIRTLSQALHFGGAADDFTWLDDFPVMGRKN